MKVHLKQNFQYRLRGTKYAIPAPKPGSAKSGSTGEGLVLREDQKEWSRAKKMADGRREKEERRVKKGIFSGDADGGDWMAGVGSWKDPDWLPGIMGGPRDSANCGRGGRRTDKDGMPVIGYGRKNPNERRRKA
jgi:RNA-binding protein NOB1